MVEHSADIPAWIALFMGLYALAAAVGELARPGFWLDMLTDLHDSPGLLYNTGILCLGLGAAIYLSSPFNPSDWLSVVITVIGGGAVIEGMLFLAFGKPFMAFARSLIGKAGRAWALFSLAFGIAFIAVALVRL